MKSKEEILNKLEELRLTNRVFGRMLNNGTTSASMIEILEWVLDEKEEKNGN